MSESIIVVPVVYELTELIYYGASTSLQYKLFSFVYKYFPLSSAPVRHIYCLYDIILSELDFVCFDRRYIVIVSLSKRIALWKS